MGHWNIPRSPGQWGSLWRSPQPRRHGVPGSGGQTALAKGASLPAGSGKASFDLHQKSLGGNGFLEHSLNLLNSSSFPGQSGLKLRHSLQFV